MSNRRIAAVQTVTNVVVECDCGMIPLVKAQHADANSAYKFMCEHHNMNPKLCMPTMRPVTVPLALSA
jgi:hypothetical protein